MDKWEYQNKPSYLENRVIREPFKRRTACTCFFIKKIIYFQVGAAIVNEEKKIVGIGYNGFPKG